MSFQFRKPVPASTSTSSDSGSDKIHYKLLRHSGPDYDELIIRLSLYAFNRLSPSDQQEQLEEIRRYHHEESDFTELFKKLKYDDQLELLSEVLQKLKCERLIPSFKQLDAEHQQQVIQQLAHVTPFSSSLWSDPEAENLLRGPEETEEDFRLRRFTQLCTDRARDAHKLIVSWKSEDDEQEKTFDDDNENNSDWKSCFSEFFLGFSIIWFQGQWASGQDMLIEQLSKEFTGVVIEKSLQNESEEDFKLRTFKELCTKVIDFRVQEEFIENAEQKLERWLLHCWDSWPMILEPQEFDRAAELLSDLSTLGFGLLSAKYQQHKIHEMSIQVESGVKKKRRLAAEVLQTSTTDPEEEKAIRMRRFTELFNQVSVPTRIDLFKELRKVLLKQKRYSEAVHFFCGLGSEVQTKMIEKLEHKIRDYARSEKFSRGEDFRLRIFKKVIEKLAHKIRDSAELIRLEKFSGESEEDLRLRRFKKVCIQHLSTWDYIVWPEADKKRVQQGTSDHNEEESPYAEFLFDVSITWFKARCANYRRNPIHVILSGQVEVIEKLPQEGEEDFRLRRFTESFKRLEFTSKESVVDYIQETLFDDLCYEARLEPQGYEPPAEGRGSFDLGYDERWEPQGYEPPTERNCMCVELPAEGRGSFDSEWIKMKLPNLQGQGATATTPQGAPVGGSATTTQAGGGIVNRR